MFLAVNSFLDVLIFFYSYNGLRPTEEDLWTLYFTTIFRFKSSLVPTRLAVTFIPYMLLYNLYYIYVYKFICYLPTRRDGRNNFKYIKNALWSHGEEENNILPNQFWVLVQVLCTVLIFSNETNNLIAHRPSGTRRFRAAVASVYSSNTDLQLHIERGTIKLDDNWAQRQLSAIIFERFKTVGMIII